MIGNAARRRNLVSRRFETKTHIESFPSPYGGVNTRDSLEAMQPIDAIKLDNWFCGVGKVSLRKGYAEHSTGMGTGSVEMLAEYHAGAVRKLLAGANNNIYDATSSPASSLASGYSNNQWQYASLQGRMHFVNGADTPQDYDGSSVAAVTWTGPTVTSLVGVYMHKHRLFFWEASSQSFWYGAVNGQSGALTEFPLGRVSQFGGNLSQMITWTIDAGNGPDDFAVFIMTSGDVIVYSGDDPGTAADWALKGIYHIGEAIGRRCAVKVGGDVLIPTVEDYVSLTSILRGLDQQKSKLSGYIPSAYETGKSLFGWQGVVNKKENMILFNVPTSATVFDQHVINTITGSPSRFKDIPSRCWSNYNTDLYFGGTGGKVYKYTGNADDGSDINSDAIQAWNSLGSKYRKRAVAVRPIIEATGDTAYEIGLGFDYSDATVTSPTTISASGSAWDVSAWDVSAWSDESAFSTDWRISHGTGHTISPRLKVNSQQAASWLRTDIRTETGKNL